MTNQVIPAEAVEAAAKAIYESESYLNKWDWPMAEPDREEYREVARAALEAAAPHMLDDARRESYEAGRDQALAGVGPIYKAEGWAEGYHAGVREESPGWTKNPYRPTP